MIRDTVEAVKGFVRSRSFSYKMVFKKDDSNATIVLRDLAKFCRAHESTFNADPRLHAVMEGRREVFLRIQQYAELGEAELISLHEIKFRPKGE